MSRTPAGPWALLPVKRLDRAKSRLAPHLGAAERAILASAMLSDVLEATAGTGHFAGILVVTGDPNAAALAERAGAAVLDDPHETGMNDAVRRGLSWLAGHDVAGVVVIPGDIPFATAHELQAVVSAMRSAEIVIVPAARDGGTNVLAMSRPDLISPSFGDGSFVQHCRSAAAAGFTPAVLSLDGAGHDIDTAGDLVFAGTSGGAGRRTQAFLSGLPRPGAPAPSNPIERAFLP